MYASTIHTIPNKAKSEYQLMNEVGISVLTIPNANILIEKTPTIIHFAVANTQNVIYPLGFTKPNAAHSINSESAQIFSAS